METQAGVRWQLLFVRQNNELNYAVNVRLRYFGLESEDFQLV